MTLPPALAGTLAVLRILPRVSRPMTLALAAGIAVQTGLPLIFMVVAGRLVGAVPSAVRNGLDSPAGHHALLLLGVAAAVIALQNVLVPVAAALASVFGRAVDRHLQERAMAAIARPAEISHLEDAEILNLITSSQAVGAHNFRPGMAVASLSTLLPSWLQALGAGVILGIFHWWLGFGWVLLWPVVLYYLQREYLRVGAASEGQASALRRAEYFRDLALAPTAAKEVRIWGLPEWLVSRFEHSWLAAMRPIWKARHPGRVVVWGTTAVVGLANAVTFGLLAVAAAHGEIGLGELAIFVQAALAVSEFRAFDDANMNLAYASVSVPSLLRLERRLEPRSHAGRTALPPGAPDEGIRFEGTSMQYPGQKDQALANVDLFIPAGRSLAIVGANGAGKTTLVKLLCGLYRPTSGEITVDGIDLAGVDPTSWQRRVAAIYQDFARLHLSARDNVGMGSIELLHDEDATKSEHALRLAGERAGILGAIESLPAGWDTILSRQYEGGVDLSGGQWQRIALARALFAVEGGARVLVLDEPTANLDVRAEAELYDRFLEITAGLTTVLISHRFSTVRRADYIVVLERGAIVERGTHEELFALGGRYAEMFRLQAERFVEETVQ